MPCGASKNVRDRLFSCVLHNFLEHESSREVPDRTAYHEAGHALMAVCLGARVRSVAIQPDDDDGPERFGDTQIEWPLAGFTERQLQESLTLVALAGPVAEMIYRGEPFHPGIVPEWAADWADAWEAASALERNEARRVAYLERATLQLHRTLEQDDHWAALAAIVDELLAHELLEGEQVTEIVAQWLAVK